MTNTVLITGANRGIGLALTQHYLKQGDKVIAAVRSSSDALDSTGAEIIDNIDVSTAEGVSKLKDALKNTNIDLLINNAGILRSEALGDINYDDVEAQLRVNAIAPLRVTEALQNNFAPNAKVALITSRMGSITDNTSGGYYGYRMSKAALNAAGMSLARDLASRGVAVAILHPGFVQTDMVGNNGDISASTAAERLAARIDALTLENSGTFWHSNGEELPW